ncbi:hypothetical protein P8452_22428 [Trifolium repens]|nr:hypothetical protein P8452_22428 [Trifolium repens]
MVAVGPGAANFVTEMSTIVLKNAPFNVEKWKNIPEDIFNKIVSKVLDAFDIDHTTHNREVILYTAKRLYRNQRCRFHRHFSQYKTNAIALEHRPDDVGEDDWKFLVDYFSSSNYKIISERNKLNKAKQFINHRCGRKSFQAVQERCSELLELGYMDEDKDKLTNTAFEAVVGVRSGYSRGLGAGIKPLKGKNIACLQEELKKEREKRQDIKKKLKDVETQRQQHLKMMEEMTSKIEESQRQLGEKVDKQVEAKVATMLRQMLNIPGGESSSALDRVSWI